MKLKRGMSMGRIHNQRIISRAAWFCILVCIGFGVNGYARAADSAWDNFVPPPDDKFDWIQLTNSEWLKGEFKVLYDYEVEFDSDELDLQTFDLEDVKQIRTHKPKSVRIEDPELNDEPIIVEGILTMIGDKIIMTVGDETREFKRNQLVSIAQTDKKEIELWSFNISLGANIRGGNTETTDLNLQANAKRRTASSRVIMDYFGNYSKAEGIETSNNHRLKGYRDYFISKKIFWRQILGEYYRDRFKNIDNQLSLATSLGYHIIKTSKTKWDISAGLGGRYTKFVSVEPGKDGDNTSPALGAGTMYDTELNKWMDFLVDYSFQIVNEESGRYTHHFITTLSTDLIGDMDLDVSFVWDRIQKPQTNSDGSVPKKDDYQVIIGFSYDI
jgi:putative salt-induced outer membrane protein YdiY